MSNKGFVLAFVCVFEIVCKCWNYYNNSTGFSLMCVGFLLGFLAHFLKILNVFPFYIKLFFLELFAVFIISFFLKMIYKNVLPFFSLSKCINIFLLLLLGNIFNDYFMFAIFFFLIIFNMQQQQQFVLNFFTTFFLCHTFS